jgi:glycosyltransferase involved in cell wall biosynthesis
MAMETPMVATDLGGVRELMGDTGFIAPAKDPYALAGAVLRIRRISEGDLLPWGEQADREFFATST